MHSQAELVRHVIDALAALGSPTDPSTVSDAVDLYLCKLERDTGRTVDRDAIDASIVAEAIETATAWLLAIGEPTMPPTSTEALAPGEAGHWSVVAEIRSDAVGEGW